MGNKSDSAGDQDNTRPSGRADVFMQYKYRKQGNQYIADGSGRQDEAEIRPGKSGQIRGEKNCEKDDAESDPWIEDGEDGLAEVPQSDRLDLVHADLQKEVTYRRAHGHRRQNHVASKIHGRKKT